MAVHLKEVTVNLLTRPSPPARLRPYGRATSRRPLIRRAVPSGRSDSASRVPLAGHRVVGSESRTPADGTSHPRRRPGTPHRESAPGFIHTTPTACPYQEPQTPLLQPPGHQSKARGLNRKPSAHAQSDTRHFPPPWDEFRCILQVKPGAQRSAYSALTTTFARLGVMRLWLWSSPALLSFGADSCPFAALCFEQYRERAWALRHLRWAWSRRVSTTWLG